MAQESAPANMAAVMEAFTKGGDIEAAAYPTQPEADSVAEESTSEETDQSPSATLEEWSKGESDEPKEAQSEDVPPVEEEADEAEVTDETPEEFEYVRAGNKRLKVDYKDKDKIKRAYLMAAGMRKFQSERDAVKAEKESVTAELTELKTMWSQIETAAQKKDYNELTRIMTAGEVDFDTLVSQRLEKERLRAESTDEEIAQMDLQERLSQLENQLNLEKTHRERDLTEAQKAREEAEIKTWQSKVNPAFSEYRFAGKLDDRALEHRLDTMLWKTAIDNLAGVDATQRTDEVIRNEFAELSRLLHRTNDKVATKAVKKASTKRKKEAKSQAQIEQVRGYSNSDKKKQAADMIKSNDLTGILKNWDSFGGLFK